MRTGPRRSPFHKGLRQVREMLAMSEDALAARWGVEVDVVRAVESGIRPVLAEEVEGLAAALGLSVRDFLRLINDA